MKIYNTLTRKKEDFAPINEKEVKMYACGITVYDECHLGHAMQAVFFDLIRRYLEYKDYKVTYVRNYTDIDDKIIERAKVRGMDPLALSEFYIKDSKSDMAALKVKPATFEPKVSDHIKEIIAFIEKLISKGHAYVFGGEVFFSVESFPGYGKLSNRKIDEMEPETLQAQGKKAPHDFALWKAAKPQEPSWDSPWGKGRPGWHIECSVLSNHYLGAYFDIHGGGLDISFPHHENEIAQSEAANDGVFAKYWIHNGLLMVENKKMSKSLGNFMTIKQALKAYHPDVLRYMIFSFSISSNVNFTASNLSAANKNVHHYYKILSAIDEVIAKNPDTSSKLSGVKVIDDIKSVFESSMDDFFNTAAFLAALPEIFKQLSEILISKKTDESKKSAIFKMFLNNFNKITDVLGVLDENPKEYIKNFNDKYLKDNNIPFEWIESKIKERAIARQNKDFKASDAIRDELLKKGITLHDKPGITDWSVSI